MTDIDVGMLSESINNKADLDLGNTNPLARVVVEVSDKSLMPSWYRVYSDGWCEQGGICTGDTAYTVTLAKNYNDTNYNVQITALYGNTGTVFNFGATNKTNSSFGLYIADSAQVGGRPANWQASGYIN